ncbi:hypothetical protein [Amycolatopsis sp. La24]|uniref:hypothetical protein n=1 Tax=Amycolatopsis sp. La24 TaxID=3028304 RepID=UPI0023B0E265|nr:hypothetical protein [Amycolatopsis sp. La24]
MRESEARIGLVVPEALGTYGGFRQRRRARTAAAVAGISAVVVDIRLDAPIPSCL